MQNIVIIGGGLAGLTAAYYLSKEKKFNITIIEKNAELGGRITSEFVDNNYYDLGGFLILPWYKEMHKLLKELNLDKKLKKFPNFKEYYFNPETRIVTSKPLFKASLREYLRYAMFLIPLFLKGKVNFHNPNYTLFQSKTTKEVLNKVLGANSFMYKGNNNLVKSYTYGDLSETPMSIFVPMSLNMTLLGYFDKSKVLSGNTYELIDRMKSYLELNGVKILTNTNAQLNKNKVFIQDQQLGYDKLLVATPLTSSIYSSLYPEVNVKYTKYSSVLIKLKESPILEGQDDWTVIYVPDDANLQTSSIYNSKSLDSNFDSRYLVMYIKKSNEITKELIQNELSTIFPNINLEEIVIERSWDSLMPIVTDELLINLRAKQGKDNIFYAGDFFSWPLMESAVYSGKSLSELIVNTSN